MGDSVLLTRRKGKTWYVAAINGTNNPKTFSPDFSFLGKGTHSLTLIKDGADDKSFLTTKSKITSRSKLTIPSLPRGGFVAAIE